MEVLYKKVGKRYVQVEQSLSLNQELVLGCAFRYALGRSTYVVGAVCEELVRLEPFLNESFKYRIAKEIQEYQDEHGKAGWDFDNDEWNYVKWLYTPERRVLLESNYYKTDKWVEAEAIRSDELDEDGEIKYLSLTNKNNYYHKVRNIKNKIE
jgi:hypothetical protein